MWKLRLGEDSADVGIIRKWLGIHDRVVRAVIADRKEAATRRDEYTCEWFQRSLFDFSRGSGDTLVVTAPFGSGKTVLASWIVERLQRPIGKKNYQTLSISIGM
jgi:hypothetical protein